MDPTAGGLRLTGPSGVGVVRERSLDGQSAPAPPAGDDGLLRTRSGLWAPRHVVEQAEPTAVDLLAGTGGASLGMIAARFEIVCAVDHDPLAAMTCLVNIGRYPMRIHFASTRTRTRTASTRRSRPNRALERAGNAALRSGTAARENVGAVVHLRRRAARDRRGHRARGRTRRLRGVRITAGLREHAGGPAMIGVPKDRGAGAAGARAVAATRQPGLSERD